MACSTENMETNLCSMCSPFQPGGIAGLKCGRIWAMSFGGFPAMKRDRTTYPP